MAQVLQADIVVIGAGAFGGWAALHLRESGADTLLVEALGAGNPHSSSGGETRIIRSGYADVGLYAEWAWKALGEWKLRQREWSVSLFVPRPVLWVGKPCDPHLMAGPRELKKRGIPSRELSPREVRDRYPLFRMGDDDIAFQETEAGFLMARRACRRVALAFADAGGRIVAGRAAPPDGRGGTAQRVRLADGTEIRADRFLFACGPWLPGLFPDLFAGRVQVTRQAVLYLGPTSRVSSRSLESMPVWIDFGSDGFYGIPSTDGAGLKVASDRDGPAYDPDRGSRSITPEDVERTRRYLRRRLPALAAAPLLSGEVCQYSRTPDQHLILDRHPRWDNVYLAGGGSGHGFKLGPVVGRTAAEMVQGRWEVVPGEVRLKNEP